MDGNALREVEPFVYCGGKVRSDGIIEEDFRRRIDLARRVMQTRSQVQGRGKRTFLSQSVFHHLFLNTVPHLKLICFPIRLLFHTLILLW